MEDKVEAIVQTLSELVEDNRIPRNIRNRLSEVKEILSDKNTEVTLRLHKAISELDDITNEQNLPMYVRTQIWFLITLLESLQS